MNPIKYLFDENVNISFKVTLRHERPDIESYRIGDPGFPKNGTLDPEILFWCDINGFILVTNNRASMPVHLEDHIRAGRHIPGIFILNANMSLRETIEELALIWEASDTDEYQDQIRFLPISK